MKNSTFKQSITRIQESESQSCDDLIAVEEPLEIRLGYATSDLIKPREHKSISITMRTPGDDFELALGFLYTEGIISSYQQVESIDYCGPEVADKSLKNTLRVDLSNDVTVDLKKLDRNFYMTSSCGVCGKASIEALYIKNQKPITQDNFMIAAENIYQLSNKLRNKQINFEKTGGIHASAIFNQQGEIELVREDVGRHNALDKLIGYQFSKNQLPLYSYGILVSGRASFELLQKAMMARSPMLVAVGAPSSLAIELAESFNITLIGFLGNNRFNIYTNKERVIV